jgi:hypothetical protein
MATRQVPVQHIDEHTLELYVLSSAPAGDVPGIKAHLLVCHGCRDLEARVRAFYGEVERQLAEHPVNLSAAEKAMVWTRRELEPWNQPASVPLRRSPPSSMEHLRAALRVHRMAVTGGSFAALAALALMINVFLTRDTVPLNPAYVSFSPAEGMVRVHAASDSVIWEKPSSYITQTGFLSPPARGSFAFQDLDHDGINEVITGFTFDDDPGSASTELKVFDWRKRLITVRSFNRPVPYPGRAYDPVFRPGSVNAGDLLGPGTGGFLAVTTNLRSPSFVVRYDGSAKECGTYWHFGQFGPAMLLDLNGDGRPEYLAGAENSVGENSGTLLPVLLVLDPAEINGDARTSTCEGFQIPVSRAELWYIAFPWSDLDSLEDRHPVVRQLMASGNGTITVSVANGQQGRTQSGFLYEFSRSMDFLGVHATTETQRIHARLLEQHRLRRPLDEPYLEDLGSRLRYWDGAAWHGSRVAVHSARPSAAAR